MAYRLVESPGLRSIQGRDHFCQLTMNVGSDYLIFKCLLPQYVINHTGTLRQMIKYIIDERDRKGGTGTPGSHCEPI